jgi:hypothetical protein
VADDDAVRAAIDELLPARLELLRRISGLPVVFAGAVEDTRSGRRLVLGRLLGTYGNSLQGLVVDPGRGLGGTVLALGTPRRINDYAASTSITHDYDRLVVGQEGITSIFALPVRASGVMRGVLYGAARDGRPIGDATVHRAAAVVARLERDVAVVLSRRPDRGPQHRPDPRSSSRARAALDDLAALARVVTDPALQEQLRRIHLDLGGRPTQVEIPPRRRSSPPASSTSCAWWPSARATPTSANDSASASTR